MKTVHIQETNLKSYLQRKDLTVNQRITLRQMRMEQLIRYARTEWKEYNYPSIEAYIKDKKHKFQADHVQYIYFWFQPYAERLADKAERAEEFDSQCRSHARYQDMLADAAWLGHTF